jgi:arylsulfatase A-like enzyme
MPLTRARADLTWYPNAFCAVPLCEPDRATVFSGQYEWHHGVTNNPKDKFFNEASDIASALHTGGYKTGIVGKRFNAFPFGKPDYCPLGYDYCAIFYKTPKPWDYNLIEGGPGTAVTRVLYPKLVNGVVYEPNYATNKIFEKALGFLDAYAPDPQQKFYLYIAPFGPHEPASPPPSDIQAITTYLTALPSFNNVGTGAPQFFTNLPAINVNTERNALRSAERGMLSVDRGLDAVFAKLAQHGRLEDTVVFFTTDQGVGYGDHKWHTKRIPYDCAVRVPFFARWGDFGMHAGTINALVSLTLISFRPSPSFPR